MSLTHKSRKHIIDIKFVLRINIPNEKLIDPKVET